MKSIETVYKIGFGPSSSHTMGPERAANLIKKEYPHVSHWHVKLYASLALTGKGHLTDYIIEKTLKPKPVTFDWLATETLPKHPNGMEMIGFDDEENVVVSWTVYSTGGGEIEIDELPRSADYGDVYEEKTFNEIKARCKKENWTLIDYVDHYEPFLSIHLHEVWRVMMDSIKRGGKNAGVLPGSLHVMRKAHVLLKEEKPSSRLIGYAYAVNEENASAGGLVVTAPTCGASGTLPAILMHNHIQNGIEDDEIINALKVAGIIGNVIRTNATVSGAEGGCQAEVGSATAMAAAADCYLRGADINTIESAAEIGLEHQLGLTCDPIGGYVQIPCIQRNGIAAIKAKEASRLAILVADTELIDFDTVVETMYQTGKDLPYAYRETSEGGLAYFYKKEKNEV
ncbi:MAG: L-serine ammonia-lyase, iron-sulfur-dependent, subunit alpha [Culicoidibacterales bacterium]